MQGGGRVVLTEKMGNEVMENVLETSTSEAECDLGTACVEVIKAKKTELRVCVFVSVNPFIFSS